MKHQSSQSAHGHGSMNASHVAGDPALQTPGELSAEAIESLNFMIQEEKMAGDLYEAFYAQTGLSLFARIARSEDKHFDALVKQAEGAGVDVGGLLALPAGEFADSDLQALYDELLAAGSASAEAALAVGQTVEQTDIADLTATLAAFDSGESVALVGVYAHLLNGSNHHLAAFDAALAA